MTDQTAQIPVIEIQTAVYMTWQRRIFRMGASLRRQLVEAFKAISEGAQLTWQDFRTWRMRLKKARAYSRTTARHKRDWRDREVVTKSTPDAKRTYEPAPVKLRTRVRAARQTARIRAEEMWTTTPDGDDWTTRTQRRINNSQLIMSGAEGPLAP